MTVPRLQTVGLRGGHGATTAFREVDLAVDEGSVVALLGPNGAGKTTFLLTLAGILPRQDGDMLVDGKAVPSGRPAVANRIGVVLVPDNRCLFMTLTVEENLKAGARKNGPRPRAMLETFPALEKRWHLPAAALSGGEQQMLAMARALIQEPRVLLVDELSMGLAPKIVEDLFQAVRRIANEHGSGVILVEQHVRLAIEVADHAVVLNHGHVVLSSDATALRSNPALLEQAYLGSAEPASA